MELFIEAVRNHPCLWNPNEKDYRHGDKKESAWHKIVDLQIPEITDIKTAKSEWKKLRDNHRDSLKRKKSGKSGQAATTVNTWKYATVMEFLIPYMKNRERSTNLTQDTNTQSTQDTNTTSTQDINEETTQNQLPEEESTSSAFVDNLLDDIPHASKKRKNDDEVIDLIKEIEKNHNRRQEERDLKRQDKHPIETFFQSMALTAKKLPTYLQNKIKRKVLEVVCECEEELESYNTNSHYGYYTSTPSPTTSTQSHNDQLSFQQI